MNDTQQLIAGRYRLEGRLGFGGMSTVHLAFDTRLERRVAVKLLAEHLADDPTFVSRFQREAQAAARLVHPNIVQIFDSGLDDQSGRHFIVMEYIEGSSCAEILRDDGWLEVDQAVAIVEQACAGLHYAHRHGVVHRDVKPGNLLRSRDGEVKLADFGIAKATEQSSITQVGSVLGTAAYLAPEQARGEEAGPRADLYALGVVTYQLISGRLPYEATSLTELALKQQQEEPALLDTLVAAVGHELAEAVAVALALDPDERYQTAREMGRAISDGADGISPLEPEAQRPSSRSRRTAAQATEATSVLAGAGRPSQRAAPAAAPATRRAVAPRQPRPGPGRAAARSGAPVPAPQRRRSSGPRRLAILLLSLLALAGVIAVIVAVTAPAPTKVTLRNVVYSDVEEASLALKQLVSENTK
ncbi:MAG TPA: protein kinase [Solirubrobacteraceae bacterium]|nr:protein kinase [Solirubrobacteraceae bacterium]